MSKKKQVKKRIPKDQQKRKGRKNLYAERVEPNLDTIKEWAKGGVLEYHMAEALNVAVSTFNEYKNKHPELKEALKGGRAVPIKQLEHTLMDAANGGYKTIDEVVILKHIKYSNGKRLEETQEAVTVKKTIFVKPDITANIFLLTNWSPDYARDPKALNVKREELEIKKKALELKEFS